ncbi:hypothetical protein PMG71_23180, partial [Roseofilum sp. BLCC_M154]|nr:hypothetical protein [Roseofilum acuticapitatum BLCC-M154]
MGVKEVWQWKEGEFSLYHLDSTGYEAIANSELLPNLDISLLTRCVKPDQQFDAVMEFRDRLRQLNDIKFAHSCPRSGNTLIKNPGSKMLPLQSDQRIRGVRASCPLLNKFSSPLAET